MKAARFDYVRPDDVAEALAALREGSGRRQAPGRRPIARADAEPAACAPGSAHRHVAARGAARRSRTSARAWRIGAGVTHARIEDMRGKLAGRRLAVRGRRRHRLSRRSATAARSAAVSPMPTRRPTGRSRWRRSAPPSTFAGARAARTIPVERFIARRLHHGARGRRDHRERSTCPSFRARARWGYLQVLPQDRRIRGSKRRGGVRSGRAAPRASFVGALRGTPQPLAGAGATRRSGSAKPPTRRQRSQAAPLQQPVEPISIASSAAMATRRGDAGLAAGVRAMTPIALDRQRAQGRRRWSSRARISPISCASTAGSPARISAASTASAAPAPC